MIEAAGQVEVRLLLFPELCITGCSCGDLFLDETLIKAAKKSIYEIREFSKRFDMVMVVGCPVKTDNRLINASVVIYNGQFLGVMPVKNRKNHFPRGK
jgi:NAD+ synthase (glutamine-hydrolysing)